MKTAAEHFLLFFFAVLGGLEIFFVLWALVH
jgi:hypothetical protein